MKRVYTPNRHDKDISTILTELYVFKHALQTESLVDLEKKIDKIRSMIVDLSEDIRK